MIDRQTGTKSNHHKWLRIGRSEVMRSLRHCLGAQSQGQHTIDRLEERVVERGSAGRSSLKGRERAVVNQTNIATTQKQRRETSKRRGGAHMGFSEHIITILKQNEAQSAPAESTHKGVN